MKKYLLLLPLLALFTSFKPAPSKLSITSVFISNNYHVDNSADVEVHVTIDAPITSTVQVLLVVKEWTYALNIPFKFGQPMYTWKWVDVSYNVFIPAGSVDGWAYGVCGVGEYASTTQYTVYGPYVL